jgi:hypothetical protein
MSQAERQVPSRTAEDRIQEIKASAHLMTLDTGLFCLVNGSTPPPHGVLAGVRISAVDPADRRVAITGFRSDGWLDGAGDSALIRIQNGPAQILVTIYQSATGPENPPKLRVLRLTDTVPTKEAPQAGPVAGAAPAPVMVLSGHHDVIAHMQRAGDVGRPFGEWLGDQGSRKWIEGFSITAPEGLTPADITYQAVLGRGWLSPWSEAGQFCGSRGMALPILGVKIRLSPKAAERYTLSYEATFVDGSAVGPVESDESCETAGLAPLEALRVSFGVKASGNASVEAMPAAALAEAAKAAKPQVVPKPSVVKPAPTPATSAAAAEAAKKVPPRRR